MIGKRLAHYQIVEKLGEGGMGQVYRAKDTRLARQVAINVLPAETAGDPERLSRFHRDARAVGTTRKTTGTMSRMWFLRNARHVRHGGFR
ncbi:MAG: hypothetical protein KAY32_15900 [Candidatus Eisenbacteria sp.]|nr:hypothetical protein [Candidatus Eisenbacteria bacterium]